MGAFETTALWLSIVLVALSSLCLVLLLVPTRRSPHDKSRRVAVLVLGDMGHSPRMQNHAMSLVDNGCTVELIGYPDSRPRPELLHSSQVNLRPLGTLPRFLKLLPFPIMAPLKVFFQCSSILYILLYQIPPPTHVLVQTPPAIPTLPVVWLAGKVRGFDVVVDWHNFGYTILALKFARGQRSLLVRLYSLVERMCAKWLCGGEGEVGFTVTKKMSEVMNLEWGTRTTLYTLYDKPPSHFQPISNDQHRLNFLEHNRLTAEFFPKTVQTPRVVASPSSLNPDYFSATASSREGTPRGPQSTPIPLPSPPKIVITSTSYTPDEDLQIFLDALVEYAHTSASRSKGPLPPVLAIITGKGPQKDLFTSKIAELSPQLNAQHVYVRQSFLPIEEYPLMLGCSDIGVCLHTSSSGIDLPMKVVDMFGVGLPVIALEYGAIGELVRWDGSATKSAENVELNDQKIAKKVVEGVLADAAQPPLPITRPRTEAIVQDLSGANGIVVPPALGGVGVGRVLVRLLADEDGELARLKHGVMQEREYGPGWEEEWNRIAKPVFFGPLAEMEPAEESKKQK